MSPRISRLHSSVLFALFVGLSCVPPVRGQAVKAKTYLFCFWNVENLFDDKPNPNLEKVDREFDTWFARDPQALTMKLDRICDVLLGKEFNGGRGPDILALAEVESLRSVELVRDALNRRLKDRTLHYKFTVYRDPRGGRSIATALVSRVPVVENRTRLLGRSQRILEMHLVEGKRELVLVASHWTSRVSDKTGRGRSSYAKLIHDAFSSAYRADPRVAFLVCGDFNDNPSDDSVVRDLSATGDLNKVLSLKKGDRPLLFNPFADLEKSKKGTLYFGNQAYLFDNVCVSPAMLDGQGWTYVNRSAAIVERLSFRGKPDRFGGPNDRRPWKNRGASDHYPVTVQLRVVP